MHVKATETVSEDEIKTATAPEENTSPPAAEVGDEEEVETEDEEDGELKEVVLGILQVGARVRITWNNDSCFGMGTVLQIDRGAHALVLFDDIGPNNQKREWCAFFTINLEVDVAGTMVANFGTSPVKLASCPARTPLEQSAADLLSVRSEFRDLLLKLKHLCAKNAHLYEDNYLTDSFDRFVERTSDSICAFEDIVENTYRIALSADDVEADEKPGATDPCACETDKPVAAA